MPFTSPLLDSWHERALCHDLVVNERQPVRLTHREAYTLFYPTRHSNKAASKAARTICTRFCSVREECAREALTTNDRFGIRGGLTADARRTLNAGKDRRSTHAFGEVDDYLAIDDDDGDDTHCPECGDGECICEA